MKVGLVAFLAAALAVACTAPTRAYVEDRDAGTSFAVPEDWRVVDLLGGSTEEGPLDLPEPDIVRRLFYAPEDELPDPFFPPTSEAPIGFTRVWTLDADEQDEMSIKRLRNSLLPIDQRLEEAPETIQLVDQSLLASEGYRGERVLFTMEVSDPDDPAAPPAYVTISQTTYLDPFTTTAYLFAVGCSVDCFQANRATISDIEASWSVIPA